jgi:hypothetical protein
MKHGDKAKKSAKGKAAIKKASSKVATPVKASQSGKGASAAGAKTLPQKIAVAAKPAAGSNGKTVARNGPVVVGFSNPIVAAAFKRAVKKYPTAFRRLTD